MRVSSRISIASVSCQGDSRLMVDGKIAAYAELKTGTIENDDLGHCLIGLLIYQRSFLISQKKYLLVKGRFQVLFKLFSLLLNSLKYLVVMIFVPKWCRATDVNCPIQRS